MPTSETKSCSTGESARCRSSYGIGLTGPIIVCTGEHDTRGRHVAFFQGARIRWTDNMAIDAPGNIWIGTFE